ncbi:hypothetical protein FM120_29235 [Sphingobacterium faecium PCAi_F2.5]|nr:hypothetical protein FM120_29235 [Sphingobacterium faecium PCAi_F2.5]
MHKRLLNILHLFSLEYNLFFNGNKARISIFTAVCERDAYAGFIF